MPRGLAVLQTMVVAMAFAAATVAIGWIGLPCAAAGWGILARRQRRMAWHAAAAGTLAWGGLLGWDALHGPVGRLGQNLGEVLGLAPLLLSGATLLFPALVAGCSAIVWAWAAAALESAGQSGQIRGQSPASSQPGSTPDA